MEVGAELQVVETRGRPGQEHVQLSRICRRTKSAAQPNPKLRFAIAEQGKNPAGPKICVRQIFEIIANIDTNRNIGKYIVLRPALLEHRAGPNLLTLNLFGDQEWVRAAG